MKFCQVLTYPEQHLERFFAARPHLLNAPFSAFAPEFSIEAPDAPLLWTSTLRELGHEAHLLVANDPVSQCQWAEERLDSFAPKEANGWIHEIVLKQLGKLKPDVICFSDPSLFGAGFLKKIHHRPRWIVGMNQCHPGGNHSWTGYDLVLSSNDAGVRDAWLKHAGDSRLLPQGFPRYVAEAVFQEPISVDVVYFGRWLPDEENRNKRVAALARASARKNGGFSMEMFLDVRGNTVVPPEVERLNRGPCHGLARYRALSRARIVVVEEPDRSVKRTILQAVFESTGVGAFTLAPAGDALARCFMVGQEVEVYDGTADLLQKIDEFLPTEARRRAVARAGQERCLTEHALENRAQMLLQWLQGSPDTLKARVRRMWRRVQAQRKN